MQRVRDSGVYAPALRVITELSGGRVSRQSSEHSRDVYLFALRTERKKARPGTDSAFPSPGLLLDLLADDARWMQPDDVQAVLLDFLESSRRRNGHEIGDYAEVVKVLARRGDVPRDLIDSLLHPFPHDDLDSLDAEFDSGLDETRTELGF